MQEVEYPAPVGGDLCGGESNWTSLTWQSARDVIDQCGRKREGSGDNRAYEQEAFLQDLHSFMRARKTPIERIPHLGFKQVDLWLLFTTVNRIGGYEQVTARRLWKHVYDVLGGNPGSTSAATCTRRHYERLLLPYERNWKSNKNISTCSPGMEMDIEAEGIKEPNINGQLEVTTDGKRRQHLDYVAEERIVVSQPEKKQVLPSDSKQQMRESPFLLTKSENKPSTVHRPSVIRAVHRGQLTQMSLQEAVPFTEPSNHFEPPMQVTPWSFHSSTHPPSSIWSYNQFAHLGASHKTRTSLTLQQNSWTTAHGGDPLIPYVTSLNRAPLQNVFYQPKSNQSVANSEDGWLSGEKTYNVGLRSTSPKKNSATSTHPFNFHASSPFCITPFSMTFIPPSKATNDQYQSAFTPSIDPFRSTSVPFLPTWPVGSLMLPGRQLVAPIPVFGNETALDSQHQNSFGDQGQDTYLRRLQHGPLACTMAQALPLFCHNNSH